MRRKIGDSDALKLCYFAKVGWALEARPRGTQHDHPAVLEKQFTVPHSRVALPIADPLGEPKTLISQSVAAFAFWYKRYGTTCGSGP
jgi:hypothetical protein